jgi:hypothetical protein
MVLQVKKNLKKLILKFKIKKIKKKKIKKIKKIDPDDFSKFYLKQLTSTSSPFYGSYNIISLTDFQLHILQILKDMQQF